MMLCFFIKETIMGWFVKVDLCVNGSETENSVSLDFACLPDNLAMRTKMGLKSLAPVFLRVTLQF